MTMGGLKFLTSIPFGVMLMHAYDRSWYQNWQLTRAQASHHKTNDGQRLDSRRLATAMINESTSIRSLTVPLMAVQAGRNGALSPERMNIK